MADSGSQQRKPDLRTAVEDAKAVVTVLAMEADSIFGRRMSRVLGVLALLALLLGVLTLIGLPFDVTLWDWLKLLIVPVVLAIGGFLFTRSENRATQAAAESRAQDEALQAYLDQMSNMLLPTEAQPSLYRARPGDSFSSVARARTLTVLTRLDGERKGSVVRFLYESGLIGKDRTVLNLQGADLSGAKLIGANLWRAWLTGDNYYKDADLRRADFSDANLNEAKYTKEQLDACKSLKGVTWTHEEWKEKEGRWPDE